jgi:hypothetical protein
MPIYDKKKEIVKSNKKWFEILWLKNGWEKEQSVTRVEFSAGENNQRDADTHY